MKKFLLGTAALIALGATAPATAADLAARPYTKAPAYVSSPIYNWTGFYIGGHVGGAFFANNSFGSTDGRLLGGGQIGYDYQFSPNFVFGLEANYSFVDNSSNTNGAFNSPFANRGLGSVTGRIGYAFGPTLLYAKGGYAWADTRFTNGFSGTMGRDGYTVGGGLEYLFTQNFSGKIEYQYYDFGNGAFTGPTGLAFGGGRNEEHTIKAGLNYRFNFGGPVVAKY